MADTPWWERKGAKLTPRDWTQIRDAWLDHLPNIDPAGTAPQAALSDLSTVQAAVSAANSDAPVETEQPILGLREGVLAEGVYLLHKAANVLGSAQVHVQRGLCSWSLSSAYQASFFGIKALLHFLGIVVIETGNQTYLVDIWHPAKKKKKGILGPQYAVMVQKVFRVEHRQMWAWLQRVFRVCTAPPTIWPTGCVTSLAGHDISAFARQRNDLHYTTTAWPFGDLHACLVIENFGLHATGLDDGVAVSDPESDDFSIALGLVILRMGCQMVADLARVAPVVKAEWDILRTWLQGDCNTLYQAGYAAGA